MPTTPKSAKMAQGGEQAVATWRQPERNYRRRWWLARAETPRGFHTTGQSAANDDHWHGTAHGSTAIPGDGTCSVSGGMKSPRGSRRD
ncbi:MAG: hypothetical protein R3C56_24485 [Pirellulaceae bacterium]